MCVNENTCPTRSPYTYHGRKEELGARIPTISGYKMLGFLAVVLTVGMEETQHVGAKVNVVNVLPSSEL